MQQGVPEGPGFTTDLVLQAMQTNSHEAIEYLNKWVMSPHPELQALEIIQGWPSPQLVFMAFQTLTNQITKYYGGIAPEVKAALLDVIKGSFNQERMQIDIIREEIIKCYTLMAVYEYPDNFGDFPVYGFASLQGEPFDVSVTLQVLSSFLKTLENSKVITGHRKMDLRLAMMGYAPDLVSRVTFCLSTPFEVNCGLRILCFLIRNSEIDAVKSMIELIQKVCFQFVYLETFSEDALYVLNALLLEKREDPPFAIFAPLVLQALGSPTSVRSDGNSVLIDDNIRMFVMDVMCIYGVNVIKALMGNPECLPVMEAAAHVGMTPEMLQGSIMNIFGNFLTLRDPVAFNNRHFYDMWMAIFYAARDPANEDIRNFVGGILNDIIGHFYQMIPGAIGDYGECPVEAMRLWSAICEIHPAVRDRMVEFLNQQAPSPELCYAIGNLKFASAKRIIDYSSLTLAFRELYEHIQGADQAYVVAVIHAFACHKDVNQQFLEIVMKCLTEFGGEIAAAAAYALERSLGSWQPTGIGNAALQALCENSEAFLVGLHPHDSVRVFKSCAVIIKKTHDPAKMAAFSQVLMKPIADRLPGWSEFPVDQIRNVLEIVTEVCYGLDSHTDAFLGMFIEPFFAMARGIITTADSGLVESCMAACGAIVATRQIDMNVMQAIVEMMMARGRLEPCFLDFLAIARAAHQEVNAIFDSVVAPAFVQPSLGDSGVWPNLLNMLRYFTFDATRIPDFWVLCFQGIMSMDDETNTQAARTVRAYLNTIGPELMIHVLPDLVLSLMTAITDAKHTNSLKIYSSLLAYLYNQAKASEAVMGQLVQIVSGALLHALGSEPEEGFFARFAGHLYEICEKGVSLDTCFYNSIANLLVMIRKLSRCDIDAFSSDWEATGNPLVDPVPDEQADPDNEPQARATNTRILPIRKCAVVRGRF